VTAVIEGLLFDDGVIPKLEDITAMAGPSVTSGKVCPADDHSLDFALT